MCLALNGGRSRQVNPSLLFTTSLAAPGLSVSARELKEKSRMTLECMARALLLGPVPVTIGSTPTFAGSQGHSLRGNGLVKAKESTDETGLGQTPTSARMRRDISDIDYKPKSMPSPGSVGVCAPSSQLTLSYTRTCWILTAGS